MSGKPGHAHRLHCDNATHADALKLDVIFGEYPDFKLNPPGARGVGEIGLAGAAAAITSPTCRFTGKRIRDLPVKVEDLL